MIEKQYLIAKELSIKSKRDRKKAKKILKSLTDYAPAQFLLAVLWKGKKKRNSKKIIGMFLAALPYYQSTTETDDGERQARLGAYYYFGDMGLEKNIEEAVKWFRIASNNGDPKAQIFLSKCLAQGLGIEKNMAESLYWIEKAAEQNDSEALTALGHCYATGQWVKKDVKKGVELLKKAMALGNKKALKIYRCLILAKEIDG